MFWFDPIELFRNGQLFLCRRYKYRQVKTGINNLEFEIDGGVNLRCI